MSVSERIAALTPEQRELFELRRRRLAAQAKKPRGDEAIPRREPDSVYPLSFDQERLWFLGYLDPRSTAYSIDTSTRMEGRLDVAALGRGLTEVVRRHEAWRTTFPEVDGRPVQVVADDLSPELGTVDLSGLDPARREALAPQVLRDLARRPFDLAKGPLVRALLTRLAEEDWICTIVVHHIVTDWVSFQLFWRELAALYVADTTGAPSPLPELPIQYADFAVWQRRWLAGETLQRYLDYWLGQLAGAPQVLALPIDRPRPEAQTTRGAEQPIEIAAPAADALKALARGEGATAFMSFLAAWKALLVRVTGQETVLIGSPNANRNRKELEPLLGFFLTQLVFATDGAGDPSFRELLGRVRRSALGAYAHQDLPFGKLLEALKPERDNSRPPLVQANFILLDAEYTALELPGLRITPLAVEDGSARFDMTLGLWDSPVRVHGFIEYNRDLFDRTTVQRLAESFAALVEHAARAPEARLSELPLLSAAARHQTLVEWNDAAAPVSAAALATVPAALARRALEAPAAPAVLCGDERLTHGELARRAERLARRLLTAGIARGDRVGLALERSADLAVGLLGIWRAGAVYLPLDPSLPRERLAFLVEDAQVAAIVTRETFRTALPAGPRLVMMERDGEREAALDGEEPGPGLPEAALDDPAYVIYTSGTTGRPKGVEVAHRSLAAVLGGIGRELGWRADDRMLSVAAYSFDIFLFELLSPLLAGGSCELLAATSPLDLDGLLRGLAAATRFHAVPALMRQVATALRVVGGAPRGLRTLLVGGEAVPAALAAELAALFPAAEVRVLYGPTEGTILAASEPWHGEARPRLGTPLGRPLPGACLRVIDVTGGLAAIGAAGEIFLGGAGVARGYVCRPELTAERFIPGDGGRSQLGGELGARLYRTGDRARWLPDGRLEFLGRVDDQVKVRGFRIEPGEVEAALAGHPEVGAAAVVARPTGGTGGIGGTGATGDRQLVAYVVPRDGIVPEPDALRAFLRDRLPEYMVPTAFVPLAVLPLTAHGKLDRRALPAPSGRRHGMGGEAARTTPKMREEEILAEVWRGVLGLDEVGVHDNFFQLGGDSILSIQVVARARRAGLIVTPKQLFENQTIAGLAAAVAAAPVVAAEVDAEQGLVEGEAPLTPVQRAFFAGGRPDPARFNQALLLTLAEALDPRLLPAALTHVALHHDALRLRFVHEDGGWRQLHAPVPPGISPDATGLAPVFTFDLASLPEARRREVVEEAAEALQEMFDLARGPLFLAALFTTGEPGWRDRLLLSAHHLIVDGVSWRVLLEDLAAAWRQLAAGVRRQKIELPAKTTSWKRWAERLAERARSPEAAAELAWWGALPVEGLVALPRASGGASPASPPGPALTVEIELAPETTRALLREAPDAYRTRIDDLLLTALARAMVTEAAEGTGAEGGPKRVLVEVEGHGREDLFAGVDLSRTVGWFTAVYPVVLELPEGGLGAAIRAVKERLRAVPCHGVGYGLLRFLGTGRGAARLAARPPAEVGFNYLGQLDGAMDGPFAAAAEEVRGTDDPAAPRRHLLEVDAMVLGGRLRAAFRHGAELAGPFVERLARRFASELAAIVEHCRTPAAGGATASDFPLADPAAVEELARAGRDLREVEDLYPLSPMQEGMLFHAVYAPGSELYFEQLACTVDGPLAAAAFARAWQRVVDRHPALRAMFLWREGRAPLQAVARRAKLLVLFADWRGEAPERLGARWEELLRADRRRGFDLGRAPLLRLALVRTGEREHRLLWSFHHLLFDGWCFSLLFAEVFAFYAALRRGGGEEPRLPAARPYRDYIAWLARRDAAGSEAFWRGELAGFASATPLPFDRPSDRMAGAVRTEDYGERALDLPPDAAAGVERLAQRLQATAGTVLQAAWGLLLGRYAGRREAVFGAVVSGRPADLPGVESTIGLFVNSVPVRLALPREAPVAAWLPRVQERQLALRLHEWTPLGRIHAASELPPGEPLFDSLVAFENYPFDDALAARLGDLAVRDLVVTERTNYALTLTAMARGGMALRLAHDRRFDGATAARMLGHLAVLLAAMAADAERPARDLPLLSPAERHQLAIEWNPSSPRLPPAITLPARFAAQAAVRPEAVADAEDGETVHLLDFDLELLPLGATGEIHVGGAGLAPGYPGRPELTAERFLPDPFGPPGARLFRSGDLARRLPDGDLEYLGRADRQAKVRGSRIEPAEARIAVAAAAPATAAEEILAAIWRQVLGREAIGRDDSFFRLGGDSILSLQVVSRARAAGLAITPAQIFELETLAAVAAAAMPLAAAEADQGPVVGAVPLTPIQRWLLDRADEPHHLNQSLLLAPVPGAGPLASAPLSGAVAALAAHHDALRLRFLREGGAWRSEIAPPGGPSPYREIDLSELPPALRTEVLGRAATDLQGSFDLARGGLFLAARFSLGEDGDRLFLLAHHLVVDGVSWRVLLEDLEAAYDRLAAGRAPDLPAKTTSWKRWAEALALRARSLEVLAELPYWRAAAAAPALPLPGTRSAAAAASPEVRHIEVGLDAEVTAALLGPASAAYRTRVDDLLLTALARALAAEAGGSDREGLRVRLDLEGHGREPIGADLDLSRTVGWFTAIYPVALALPEGGVGDAIVAVKEQLREVPGRGLGHGLLSYLSPGLSSSEGAGLAALPVPDLAFNYLGQLDAALGLASRWRLVSEPTGPEESPRGRPRHAVEVNAWVLDGRLRAAWAADASRVDPAAVERLARRFASELAAVVAHCLSPEAGAFTPSDFPLAGIDQAAVDRLLGRGAALDRAVEDVYPLSPLQEGMLAETLRAPRAALYFEQLACTLSGDLDAGAFARAWQVVVDRHTALRSEFVWEGLPRPLQVVRRGALLPWTREDWRGQAAGEERLAAWLAADRARGFDLSFGLGRAPLQRAALFQVREREHRFVWSFHHLLLDGWCLGLVFREVFACYQAIAAGGAPELPLARPYRDLVAWLARQDPAAAEAYFRRALAGFTTATPLPLDRPLASISDPAPPTWRERPLAPELVGALSSLARDRSLTLNTLVQGAWALLLARLAGVDDVVFGTVVAGRPAEVPGVESIVGLFINTLPARARIEPAAPLAVWLRGLQESQVELRRHEQTPLAAIQRWSDLSPGEPLFASFVAFENYPVDAALAADLEAPGLAVGDVVFADRTGFPLSLAALPGRGSGELGLRLAHDHRTDGATVERLLGRLEALLAGFAVSPEERLAELPWLPAGEEGEIRSHGVSMIAGTALDDGLPVSPRTPAERILAGIWRDLLGCGEPSVHASFFRLGGDSILSLQAVVRARAAGLVITPAQVFELQTIAALAAAAVPVEPGGADAGASPELRAELSHWLAAAAAPPFRLPRDGSPSAAAGGTIALDPLPAHPLAETAAAYGMDLGELVVAALAQALLPELGAEPGAESEATASRFDLGMRRSEECPPVEVADLFPAVLAVPTEAGPGEALVAVKEQLRAIPGGGRGYDRLRRSGLPEAAPLAEMPPAEVAFRWLGKAAPDAERRADADHALAIDAWIAGGSLRSAWRHRAGLDRGAVERHAHRFAGALAGLAVHGASPEAGAYTPSDFPLARLDQPALDALLGRWAARDRGVLDVYPLAPLQEGMLIEALRAPRAGLYFEHLACTLVGDLDAAAFERAWQAVVDRHTALRTAFAWDGLARPLQVVRRDVQLPWTREDWRGLAAAEREARLAAWLAEDRARGFDLASAPLQRAALLRLGEREHRFVWSFHHLLLDGWCFALVFRDLFALYEEARVGRPADLPPARPYRDLLAWLDRRDPGEAEGFFREALAGFTAPTRLPLDRPAAPPPTAAEPPRDRGVSLSPAVAAGLGRLARERGLTLNTLVQGAWALALARAAAADDVVFGTVVSGRPPELPGVESIVGLFINTLPVRAVVDPAAPAAAWLACLQADQVAMRRHEHAPLAEVQRASEVPPGEPLFASLVAFERFPLDDATGAPPAGVEIRDVIFSDRTELPLTLAAIPSGGPGDGGVRPALELRIAHDHRADATTVERLLGQLATLLAGFAEVPDRPLRDLPWLAAAEAHQLVREWNDTGEAPAELCLHELVAARARATPEATAVIGGEDELTYAELAAASARFARRLRALGAGPEVPVGLWCERSAAMVAAVLGILESGAAYVPIDPDEPAERLARLLTEALSGAPVRLLATTSGLLARLPGGRPPAGIQAVLLDGPLDEEPAEDATPHRAARPENLAYVLYTSGSTGVPKGVAVEHRSAVAYVRAIAERYGFEPRSRALQFASLAFDASVEEIFCPLASGATLFVRTEVDDAVRFLARCRAQRLTHLSLPSAYWHQLAAALSTGEAELPPDLQLVVFGGERALPEIWDRWTAFAAAHDRGVRLVNAYGPTEATIAATVHEHVGRVEALVMESGREVPIGRPLPGVRAHALDGEVRPVAIGAAGELYLGGAGVARGYLGRPQATAASFVPDPFGPPGARLYRSGDLVRALASGGLEFAGRADAQVKVRGFRIELGEIEAALAAHPEVREAAVVTAEEGAGERRLLAFVVPRAAGDPPALPEGLGAFLAARLPAYMLPELAALAALPLTPGGKVDRRALRAAALLRARAERPVVVPRNAVEERLVDLWREILGIPRVSVLDDFFALGGHSLAATRLAGRLRAELGVEMPLARLFELRRLEDLAAAILDERLGSPDLAAMMAEIDGLSDEEALGLLGQMSGDGGDEEATPP